MNEFGNLITPLEALPNKPKRIILHWTGGGPKANSVDLAHYHLVVNQDGTVVKGVHPIAQNMKKLSVKDTYASHTGGFNSFSIGLSYAGMKDSHLGKDETKYPLTEKQVRVGLKLAAALCKEYQLDPSNPAHLFTHTEAWTLHKIKGQMNDQKIDITILPFLPNLKSSECGPWLRKTAKEYYDKM